MRLLGPVQSSGQSCGIFLSCPSTWGQSIRLCTRRTTRRQGLYSRVGGREAGVYEINLIPLLLCSTGSGTLAGQKTSFLTVSGGLIDKLAQKSTSTDTGTLVGHKTDNNVTNKSLDLCLSTYMKGDMKKKSMNYSKGDQMFCQRWGNTNWYCVSHAFQWECLCVVCSLIRNLWMISCVI